MLVCCVLCCCVKRSMVCGARVVVWSSELQFGGWCSVMWCDVVWCDVVWCEMCRVVWWGVIKMVWSVVRSDLLWCGVGLFRE